MVKVVKILFGFVGFLFLLISLVGFLAAPDDEKTVVYVFFIMGAFSIWFAFKYKGQTKNTLPVKRQVTQTRQVSIEKLDVNRIVMQMMESIDIVSTTRNLDTLLSRLQFLKKVMQEAIQAYNTRDYKLQAVDTIDNYKQLYYDRDITAKQMEAVTNPMDFNFNVFAGWTLFNCFINHYTIQIIEVEKLKTKNGKLSRYKKLYNNLDQTISYIDNDYKSESSAEYLEKLKPFKKEIESKLL